MIVSIVGSVLWLRKSRLFWYNTLCLFRASSDPNPRENGDIHMHSEEALNYYLEE
jgi:hypothetical protein